MSKSILYIYLFLILSSQYVHLFEICGPNSKFSNCASPCPPTCSERNPFCTQVCVTGCICDPGYVMNENGFCIPEDQCSGLCGPNSKFSNCASPCPRTCSERDPFCVQHCVNGCICDPGYLMDENGICIPEDECSGTCGPNSAFSTCASPCPATCADTNPFCMQMCVNGCKCNYGYLQDANGVCIPEDQCPENPCGPNAIYSNCASYCPPTCWQRKRTCPQICLDGCVCIPGFVLDGNGKCISEDQCPQKNECGMDDEEYSDCGTECPAICNNLYSTCIQQCVPGCFCKTGYARDGKGKCIPIAQCPKNGCSNNKEDNECASACPTSCINLKSICMQQCVPDCFCKKGYIRDDNGKCIPENLCPKNIEGL